MPKLSITKFNSTYEARLSFWVIIQHKWTKRIWPLRPNVCLSKSFLEQKVLVQIEELFFSKDGYERVKSMLEKEYGKITELVNAHISNIMNLRVVIAANPKKVQEFYKVLAYNVESFVKGNVRSVLDKLKGIKEKFRAWSTRLARLGFPTSC